MVKGGAFNGGLFCRGAIMYQCSGGVLWGVAHSRGTVSGKIVSHNNIMLLAISLFLL